MALSLLGAPGPAVAARAIGPEIHVVLTTENLRDALSRMPGVRFGPFRPGRAIHVNDRIRYQRIFGFGAAITDTSAWLLRGLPAATRARAVAELASEDDWVRIPIAASDFTHNGIPYSFDDMPSGETDPTLAHFSIAHDYAYILPVLHQLVRDDPRARFFASPWSYPGWMKANDALDNANYSGLLLPPYYQYAADYIARFVEAYDSAGVPISAVSPINEGGTPSLYPGTTFANEPEYVVKYLSPTLRAAEPSVKIYDLDGGNYTVFPEEAQLLANPAYRAAITGTAVHCYAGLGPMTMLHDANPHGSVVMTECSPNHNAYPTTEVGIASLDNWAQGVELWNAALNPDGGPKLQVPGCDHCGALLTIAGRRFWRTLNYYQLGQLARFITPGAVRVYATRWVSDWTKATGYGVTPGLDDTAAIDPDGERVLVAYNNSRSPIHFRADWRRETFAYTLQAHATATFMWH